MAKLRYEQRLYFAFLNILTADEDKLKSSVSSLAIKYEVTLIVPRYGEK